MAKSKAPKRSSPVVPLGYSPPSPRDQMRMSAEESANTAIRHHPVVKRLRGQMTRDLMRTMMKKSGAGANG